MRIAIIGAGIAGNVAAWHLHRAGHDIAMFEAGSHAGGHTHTHDIDGLAIDTGFIVFNDRTYPNFVALLDKLGVASQPSAMSFSVKNEASGLEYNGTRLATMFAQRRNLVRPSFYRMLADIVRFNRDAPRLLHEPGTPTLGEYLQRSRYSAQFVDDYLVPMSAAIWSTDPQRMFDFPARFMVRFLANHGMLSIDNRPQWRVIRGGSARYVERLVAPFRHCIRLNTPVRSMRRSATAACSSTASASTMRSSPAIPTRRSPFSPIHRPPSAKYSARSATRRTKRYCIPIPRCCRVDAAPGPHGTITSGPAAVDPWR